MIVWTHQLADGSSLVQCPFCERHKKIVFPKIDGIGESLTIKTTCECGKSFTLALDKRRDARKATNLTGGYFHVRREYRGMITIKSLSKSGAAIELETERRMLKNDRLILRFNLDDKLQTYVEKEAKIKRFDGMELGLEFVKDVPENDPLFLYLQEAEAQWQ